MALRPTRRSACRGRGGAVPGVDSGGRARRDRRTRGGRASRFGSSPTGSRRVSRSSALSADDLETVDLAKALAQPPHESVPNDVALILYPGNAKDLHGAMHTHASLMAQAEGGEHWLGVREDEAVWCTAAEGSAASIWLLFAAWRERANIVVVDLELDPEAQLELFGRLRPAAVWFSDDEYDALASATVPGWIDLGSIRRAL